MKIVRRTVDPVDVLTLHGRLAEEGDLGELHDLLQSLADEGRTKIVLDLAYVPWVDSAGLGALIRAYYAFVRRSGRLKLAAPNPRVEDALFTIDLHSVFDVYATESEAIAALATRLSEPDLEHEG